MYVIGDFFQTEPYKMEGDYMYLKCEDSYVHLLKKVALSMKYLQEIYEIKEGFLRCGDDLEFNEDNLIKFIEGPKFDYYGQSWQKKNIKITNPEVMKPPIRDMFMANYFRSHPEDLKNPQFNLQNVNMDKYVTRPNNTHLRVRGHLLSFHESRGCIIDPFRSDSYECVSSRYLYE